MPRCLYCVLGATLVFLNCVTRVHYIPDPQKDIEMWVQNLGQQRSFRYRYELKTNTVFTRAHGECVVNRAEHVQGAWHSPDSQVPFEYYGFGDIEYSREQGRWRVMPRGDESDILVQVTRLLEFRTFEYLGMDGAYTYSFKANIPFLVPGRWKEMIGVMQVSARNFLPAVIWAGLPDSSVYWRIELYDYNRPKGIDPPVRGLKTFRIPLAHEYLKAFKKRLALTDITYRLNRQTYDILLSLPDYLSAEDVQKLLHTSVIRVYGVTHDKHAASQVGYIDGAESKPLYLTDLLSTGPDIEHVDIKFDGASRPYLALKFSATGTFPGMIAFEVDSMIVGTAVLDTLKNISTIAMYSAMSFYELQLLRASILQPLPEVELKLEGEGVE